MAKLTICIGLTMLAAIPSAAGAQPERKPDNRAACEIIRARALHVGETMIFVGQFHRSYHGAWIEIAGCNPGISIEQINDQVDEVLFKADPMPWGGERTITATFSAVIVHGTPNPDFPTDDGIRMNIIAVRDVSVEKSGN